VVLVADAVVSSLTCALPHCQASPPFSPVFVCLQLTVFERLR
jgi:hypothetical protein